MLINIIPIIALLTLVDANAEDVFDRQRNDEWFEDGRKLLQNNVKLKPITKTAKNVILFVGDGMGISTVTAARILDGQMKGGKGEENVLSFEEFPWSALSKTYDVNHQVPDSAATATAFLTGVKTNDEVVGLDSRAVRGNCSSVEDARVLSIVALAERAGMSTGIISTARITHATPAAGYAQSPHRDMENDAKTAKLNGTGCVDIARQLIEYPHGDGIDVVMGGGRLSFFPTSYKDPEGEKDYGQRLDGRNLTDEWKEKFSKSSYVSNKEQLENVAEEECDHLLGLFSYSHMDYEIDRDATSQPSVAEMTEKAIKILSKNPKGFFLLVEGGRVDHGHHANLAKKSLTDAIALAKAVTKAREMTKIDETLIIVTADHSHVFTIAGYPTRGNDILGLVDTKVGDDNLPYLTLGYANGPGGVTSYPREDLTSVDTKAKTFKQQAMVPLPSETHGGEDVGIYAQGPSGHLFHGVVEQNYIFHVMDHALCLSESAQENCRKYKTRGLVSGTSFFPPMTWLVICAVALNTFVTI